MINAQSSPIQNNLDMQQSSSKYGNFKGNLLKKKQLQQKGNQEWRLHLLCGYGAWTCLQQVVL